MKANVETAIKELHRAFYIFNEEYYQNKLPEPAILIQGRGNKKNVLAWCSCNQTWKDEKSGVQRYEINMVAEYLNRTIYEIIGSLLHEMTHLYNLTNDIQDVSRNGTYHNKRFKEVAEAHGLIISHDKKLGWSITKINEITKELIKRYGLNEEAFNLVKINDDDGKDTSSGANKKKSSIIKWVCPGCGTIIRSSKKVHVMCIECKQKFIADIKIEDEDEKSTM